MSIRSVTVWILACAAFSLPGCRSSRPAEERKETAKTPPPETKKETPVVRPEPKQDSAPIQAETEEDRKRLEEVLKGKTVGEQQDIVESDRFYDLALAYYNKGDFEKAQASLRQALRKNPENLKARELLAKVDSILSGTGEAFGARTIQDDRVREISTKIEAAQIEIFNNIRNGERYYNARMYSEAIREFEGAEFKIQHIPYDVPSLMKLEPMVSQQLRKARDAQVREGERVREMQRKAAESEEYAHQVATRREVTQKIASLLELAYMAFDQKKFDQCIRLCREILIIDPHYTVATELRADAEKARHRDEYYRFIRRKVDNWKQLTDSDEEAVIPYVESVRFPSREEWQTISERIKQSVIKSQEGAAQEDEDILAIQQTLEKTKIDMGFDSSKLEDIVAFIRDFTNLNIVIDETIRDTVDLEKTITFKVKDLVLKNVLKLLLSQFGLDYQITPEKVVFITTPDKAGGKAVVELHDIRDILVKIQDFPGPKVELSAPSTGGTPLTGATFSLEEPKESSVSQEQIVELIKENIGGASAWEGEYTIELTPNQQLLVSHTPKVHREIREFLAKLRSYTGTMVSVTARFIAAFDDFLDDVGVDIINRPVTPAGSWDAPGVGLTDIDESADFPIGLPGSEVGPGFITNESARLEAYDLRAQTFHTLLRFDPLTGIGIDPLQGRLFNQGGLGLQYQWLGEQQLHSVLRALHKQQKATLVQAPRITVFNTQRSHIMVLTQVSYIQDLDPQIATLAAAYDPVIGILTQGVVLDVRPIVSNDRKYVTLELRPSLAELQALRAIDINTGNPNPPAGTTIIQLPWLVLQKAETTVTVPDRGTIMISGFKDIIMRDLHSGVPFLEHIPVLNFFFTRKGKTDEKRRLMILVTPEIIDLSEKEEEQY